MLFYLTNACQSAILIELHIGNLKMSGNIRSPAKRQTIDFLTATKASPNEAYVFTITGNESQAQRFVHRMRVELSRMRNHAKAQGRTIRHFKMIIDKVETNPENEKQTIITLLRTTSAHNVDDEVDAIMDEIAGGETINV